ncbi:peptide deformylase [soil metagenome]
MILKVVGVKDPVLRQKAKPVLKIDKKILGLIADMHDTLKSQKDPEGVGLAAPQIGKSLRIFVVDYKNLKRVIINPEIVEISKVKKLNSESKEKDILEGCLSLPHYYGPIKRSKKIKIKFMDEKGKEQTEEFEGFNAQIIQHEIDHLNGTLFIDKIIEQDSPLYKFDGDEWEEVELI